MLTVIAAAVRDEAGTIYALAPPARHGDVFAWMQSRGVPKQRWQQGFLLSNGKFECRAASAVIAFASGQNDHEPTILITEHLW